MMTPEFHQPVLVNEIITLLDPRPGGVVLDATLGGGGCAEALLERIGPRGKLIGIDRDPDALQYSQKRLADYGDRAILIRGNLRDVDRILASVGVSKLDGAVADLGVSSHQLSTRGFSFLRDENLDMRMSVLEQDAPTAAHVVNAYSQADLERIIRRCGERFAGRIARAIVERRKRSPITTTGELAETIRAAVAGKHRASDIHPATKSFLAVRLEVNRELEAIEVGLPKIVEALAENARICVVAFHSLEDRIVKDTFRRLSGRCQCPAGMPDCRCGARKLLRVSLKKPVVPSAEEVANNPRSRSAKLRCAERIA